MIETAPQADKVSDSNALPRWLKFFAPAPAAPVVRAEAIENAFRSWRFRVLLVSIVAYAAFYFVRSNLDMAIPAMEKALGITKAQLGLYITLHSLLYGVSKFANGFLGDRCNARSFMFVGLLGSAVLNVMFGWSSGLIAFGVIWMLNGWVQGMGFPPCARLLTHWFPPKQLATKMSIWNTSHCIGAGLIFALCGYLAPMGWRLCFFVPAGIAAIIAIVVWFALPDTPASVGLPELRETQHLSAEEPGETRSEAVGRLVFRSKFVWLFSLANFFVYTLRYALQHWGPAFLTQAKHLNIVHAGWMMLGFEFAGMCGALVAGRVTDRFFGGRCARAAIIFMVLAGFSILAFWKYTGDSKILSTMLLCLSGFFIYGPQCLIGIAAANLATKRAAATAVGLTGLFGYASSPLFGYGLGALVDKRGWDAGFVGLLGVAVIGTIVFVAALPAKAHGYAEETK
jgi:OPA family glycerol-3-phosphate transporter-like MFS transporter/OPA family sugar phosphate sensor protein UhpC-like MFS transporter